MNRADISTNSRDAGGALLHADVGGDAVAGGASASFQALGQLSASIVHEISSPLTAILVSAEAAQRWMEGPHPDLDRARASVARLACEARRARSIAQALKALIHPREALREPFGVMEALDEALGWASSEMAVGEVTLSRSICTGARVCGHRLQIQQVVLNLLRNGAEAMTQNPPDRRILNVSSWAVDSEVFVAVMDNGEGASPDDFEHLFDALFTTKETGMGLGLAVCRQILAVHDGRIWATRNLDAGLTVTFVLPLHTAEEA